MRRRQVLAALALLPVAHRLHASQDPQGAEPVRTLLAIHDIGSDTRPDRLEPVLATLMAGAVPVSLILRPQSGDGRRMQPDTDIARLLRRYHAMFPGLIELVVRAPDLGRLRPFQKARVASDARALLCAALWPTAEIDGAAQRIATLACRQEAGAGPLSAVAAAGFRNVLSLPLLSLPVSAELNAQGVLALLGGTRTTLPDAAAQIGAAGDRLQATLLLSAVEINRTDPAALGAATARLADAVGEAEMAQRIVPMRVRDLQMRTDAAFRRRIGLHLIAPDARDGEAGTAFAAFTAALDSARLPYSTAPAAGRALPDLAAYWLARPIAGQLPVGPLIPLAEGTEPGVEADTVPPGPGLVVVLNAGATARFGPDDRARLHLPVIALLDGPLSPDGVLLPGADDATEGILVVAPGAIRSPAQRTMVVRGLAALADAHGTAFLSLPDYVAAILPDDSVLPSLLRTDAAALRRPAPLHKVAPEEAAALRQDARAAWAYFERGTNRSTGLCRATLVFGDDGYAGFESVTMWEVGSHLNALMAASDLGLIPDDDFAKRCGAVLKSVARAVGGRLRLPPETIHSRTGRGTRSFNSYDTGRLLIALDRLRRHRLAPQGIAEMVAAWDFSSIVLNRRLHSVKSGAMIDDFASNYTDYAAAGLRAWGYDVASPFDVMRHPASADDRMALLYTVSAQGPLGAEPTLLQLLDLGPAAAPGYLADVLYATQRDAFAATGDLVIPSESPIDRSPWFTYQGFRLDDPAPATTVTAESDRPDQLAPAFLASLRASSSKAAYLWRALRPDGLTRDMTAMIRRAARTASGFESAVYASSGLSTRNYADLNTNGVILQCVAAILAGSGRASRAR